MNSDRLVIDDMAAAAAAAAAVLLMAMAMAMTMMQSTRDLLLLSGCF